MQIHQSVISMKQGHFILGEVFYVRHRCIRTRVQHLKFCFLYLFICLFIFSFRQLETWTGTLPVIKKRIRHCYILKYKYINLSLQFTKLGHSISGVFESDTDAYEHILENCPTFEFFFSFFYFFVYSFRRVGT